MLPQDFIPSEKSGDINLPFCVRARREAKPDWHKVRTDDDRSGDTLLCALEGDIYHLSGNLHKKPPTDATGRDSNGSLSGDCVRARTARGNAIHRRNSTPHWP